MVELIFWCSFSFVLYVYGGYPLLLWLWKACASKPVCKRPGEPTVTIIIAAYNEEATIERKLSNCLEIDYPKDKLQIVVSLDGSGDGTERIARRYEGSGIQVVSSDMHVGKAAALNRAVDLARGDIIVFTDARQRVHPSAIRELVSNFADAGVGAASGELVLRNQSSDREDTGSVGLYWRYEKRLRIWESCVHSTIGASGALYAVRREGFRPIPDDLILDDVAIPMQAVLAGRRLVFDSNARVFDVACTPDVEYRRKVRTLAGLCQLMNRMPALLVPGRNPIALQFVSHKVLRLLVPYCLVALFVSNLFLPGAFYRFALALQAGWYLLAGSGWVVSRLSQRTPRPTFSWLGRLREDL
jgi:cellulose synthase/poly-beta-1,6-N-acetylglucosamine synthase-like glycosyltransferase